MIHPDTELKLVSPVIGYGVFATRPIPAGTIVYVRDALELAVAPDSDWVSNPLYRPIVEKYAYIDPTGDRIISWDIAKYVNHSCNANTLSTGYGFEIAVRDIAAGEEMTDDYGLFNVDHAFACSCGSEHCRGQIRATDVDTRAARFDEQVRRAMAEFNRVDQPLLGYVDARTHGEVMRYLHGQSRIWSVRKLKVRAAARRRAAIG